LLSLSLQGFAACTVKLLHLPPPASLRP
jgi:hypothetical protein